MTKVDKIVIDGGRVFTFLKARGLETGSSLVEEVPEGWMGLDNGPESTKLIQDALGDCKTVIWNGPMGVFEFEAFAKGTFAIADTLADITGKGCITIIGGGDSVA